MNLSFCSSGDQALLTYCKAIRLGLNVAKDLTTLRISACSKFCVRYRMRKW